MPRTPEVTAPHDPRIGIVAPSSRVPKVELRLGVEQLHASGLVTEVHAQTKGAHLYLAGTDEERARAFMDYAINPSIDVLWAARGGYGAQRILPYLDKMSAGRKIPSQKLFVGYSDSTALFEYVKNKWGWSVLHAPMPGLRSFLQFTSDEWKSLLAFVRKTPLEKPWGNLKLKQVGGPKLPQKIEAELTGGNLVVWTSLAGTPYFSKGANRILFFEEVSEYVYRIDRELTQLDQSGGLDGVRAIILGDFLDCKDSAPQALKAMPKKGLADPILKALKPKHMEPLRKTLDEKKIVPGLFVEAGERHGIPVFSGFPAGHGPGHFPLPIGAMYYLSPNGELRLSQWNWTR